MSPSVSVRARRSARLPYAVAAAVCVTSAVTMLQLGGGGATATPPLTCTTGTPASNVLGQATGWTEFVETNGNRGAESEGAIAYGGNLPTAMPVGSHLVGVDPEDPTLVIAGSHGSTFQLKVGSAYVNPQSGVDFQDPSPAADYLATNPIDFADAFDDLRALSSSWGGEPANGTVANGVTGGNAALVFTGTNPSLNIFNLTPAQVSELAGGKHVGYDVPAGATTIINVPGTSVTIGGQAWIGSGSSWQQVQDNNIKGHYNGLLWNFPDATSLTLNYGSAWAGHILAPKAALNVVGGGHNIGQVIAKSFSSNLETHYNLFWSQACVPGDPPPSDSDVTITKTASDPTPHGGDLVTYTLLVENLGDADATDVEVTDVLPAGVTFDSADPLCSHAAGTVTCDLGTIPAHGSKTVTIKVVANPIAGAGPSSHPQAIHWLTPYHREVQVDLEPGEQKSVTLSCKPDDILSDGQFRIDHVDQDTGTIADDVVILSSQLSGLGVGTWKGVIRNDAGGRAQAKAFIVCLPKETEAADRQTGYGDSHKHPLSADPVPVTSTATYAAGRPTATLTCPVGTMPIAPGFDAPAGGVALVGSEYDESSPRQWTFTLDVDAPTTVTLSVRCLRTTVGPVLGHTHELKFRHIVDTVSVPGHTAKEGNEFKVICPDDAKGVVATWNLPPGLKHFGNDPRIKERAFRLFNDTGNAKPATIDLLCLGDRTSTERMGTEDPVVVPNVATVSSASYDANEFNNSSTATITVQPGSSTTGLGGMGKVAGGTFSLKVASSMPGQGALTVTSGGSLLAQGKVRLRPGGAATAELRLTPAGKRQLGKLQKVTVRVDPSRGKATTRTVTVQR